MNRLSVKNVFRLTIHGQTVTKLITVLLSAFAFMLFAIGSMGFTYDYEDYLTRGYLNYCKDKNYIRYLKINDVSANAWSDPTETLIPTEAIDRLAETVNSPFVYRDLYPVSQLYYVSDPRSKGEDLSNEELSIFTNDCLAGSPEGYEAIGFTLLAGRYPTAKNEIAISEKHFEVFQKQGYRNVAKNYVWTIRGAGEYQEELFVYDYNSTYPEAVAIETYSDIIGKTFGCGDMETDEHAYELTIVGVVDTNWNAEESKIGFSIGGSWMYSEERKDDFQIRAVYSAPITEYGAMKKLVKATLAWCKEAEQSSAGYVLMPDHMDNLFHADGFYNENIWAVICGGAGVFFGIFAVLLNGHLTTVSIDGKQKKIGILRAMGANERTVTQIFLFETLITATLIFLFALAGSLALYYGWLNPWFMMEDFEVNFLVYNGWTVLILAAFCYAVPLLCTVVPLKKFFRKPIIDNITGNTVTKPKGRK